MAESMTANKDEIESQIMAESVEQEAPHRILVDESLEALSQSIQEACKEFRQKLELTIKEGNEKEGEDRKPVSLQSKNIGMFPLAKHLAAESDIYEAVRNYLMPNQSLSVQKANLNIHIRAVQIMAQDIYQITPEQFDKAYSTAFNDKYGFTHAIRRIEELAPASVQRQCMFSTKNIMFSLCFPDYYKEHMDPHTDYLDICFCDGDLKRALKHAGSSKDIVLDSHTKSKCNHGADVDVIVFEALDHLFVEMHMEVKEIFHTLAHLREAKFNLPVFDVIKARDCYISPLDFYFLNMQAEDQRDYINDYLRAKAETNEKIHLVMSDLIELFNEYGFIDTKEVSEEYDMTL